MERKLNFIKQIKKIRKNILYGKLSKIFLLFVFSILNTIILFNKIMERDLITTFVLMLSEVLIIIIIIVLFKTSIELFKIENSRIFQCINNIETVSEIIVNPDRIIFELKGMEDETIYITQSKQKSEILKNIKEIFGENKIVINS